MNALSRAGKQDSLRSCANATAAIVDASDMRVVSDMRIVCGMRDTRDIRDIRDMCAMCGVCDVCGAITKTSSPE